ncbi:unnamed protein product [Zymoseptoria tritici ST99CH_1A5]|uniref:Uncharacterized protein n=1 Tax=Zymoseptoria tritici ST99CH_1A5 TaxID=1276529 RepID=A0A1Y6LL41_ZYMTR|nr:unnamed protein product [Zymoseptoria tritici ST99CH_1A5]
MSTDSNMAAAALLKGRAYEQMMVQFCTDAQAQYPDTWESVISNAHAEITQLEAAIKNYIKDHSSGFCGVCMWLRLIKSDEFGGQLLPGWRLPNDKDDAVWEDRLDKLMPTLQDRAIKELGWETINFSCEDSEHKPTEGMKITMQTAAPTAIKPAGPLPAKKAKVLPPHMRSSGPLPTATNTFTDPDAIRAKNQHPTPPQSVSPEPIPVDDRFTAMQRLNFTVSPELDPVDDKLAPSCTTTLVNIPYDQDLAAATTDTSLAQDIRSTLEAQAAKFIDETLATTEAKIEAVIQSRVQEQVKEQKMEWFLEYSRKQSLQAEEAQKKMREEKVMWEQEVRERLEKDMAELKTRVEIDLRKSMELIKSIQAEATEEKRQWETELRKKVKVEMAQEASKYEKELEARLKAEMAEEKVQQEKDLRERLMANMSRALMQ